MVSKPPEAGEILQGTLDMLILRTLVMGRLMAAHRAGHRAAISENVLEVENKAKVRPPDARLRHRTLADCPARPDAGNARSW